VRSNWFDAAMRQENEEVLRRPELDLSRQRVDDLLAAIDDTGWEVAAVPPGRNPSPIPTTRRFSWFPAQPEASW
jgi:hypothetical protein